MVVQVAVYKIKQTSYDDKDTGDKTGQHHDRDDDLLQTGAAIFHSRTIISFFGTRECRGVAHRPLGGVIRRCGGVRRHSRVGRCAGALLAYQH